MTGLEREELERLASEYALGTLQGDERLLFESLLEDSQEAREVLAAWEDRLQETLGEAPAQAPPAALWHRIAQRIEPVAAPLPDSAGERMAAIVEGLRVELNRWRIAAFSATAALLALVVFIALGTPGLERPQPATIVAVLQPSGAAPSLLVDAGLSGAVIRPAAPLDVPHGRSLELWAITGEDSAPRSLGLLDASGETQVPLPPDLAGGRAGGVILAVSLEPLGGSPTGQPTGEVLYSGRLERLGANPQ